jgi:ABC-type multidrug transport system ATPase subunit
MKIVSIKRDKKENKNGLDSINLNNLGKVVVLTGANGSGKTRMLETVKEMYIGYNDCKTEISKTRSNLIRDKELTEKSATGVFHIEFNAFPYTSVIERREQDLKTKYNITVSDDEKTITIIDLSHELNANLLNPDDYKLSEMKNIFDRIYKSSFQEIYKNINIILYYLLTEKYVKVHSDKYIEKLEVDSIDKMVADIIHIIKTNLNLDITYNDTGIFFNSQNVKTLSMGQLIILKLSIASYFRKQEINDNILIFDEPENHLHPRAVIEIIDFINKSVGQIWIATHNISIVSHYYSQSILFIENGRIKVDGPLQISVLDSLLGVNSDEIRIFIDSAYDFGLTQFSYDCLFKPVAVENCGSNDLQMLEFKEIVLQKINKSTQNKIMFLDYGAGKGRLLSFLSETNELDSILTKLDYFAYDEDSPDEIICKSLISTVYNDVDTVRYYNNIDMLINSELKFDIILLANVLHEIPVINWIDLFHDKLYKILSDEGILLILENSEMLTGENAHKFGFLAIDSESIKKVFQNNDIICISNKLPLPSNVSPEKIRRVQAHIISRENILNVSQESISEMLNNIQQKAIVEITNIKKTDIKDLVQGKKLGFYYQQYASSSMALCEINRLKN